MRFSLIVAMSENRVIGCQGRLPWRLAADLRRFKRLTMGHHIIMGRKTFEAIGRPLPGRVSVVLTRRSSVPHQGVLMARSLDEARCLAADDDEVFVIGGSEVYRKALPMVDRIYLTEVHGQIEGDAFFPDWQPDAWRLVERSRHEADEHNQYAHTFLIYDRIEG